MLSLTKFDTLAHLVSCHINYQHTVTRNACINNNIILVASYENREFRVHPIFTNAVNH